MRKKRASKNRVALLVAELDAPLSPLPAHHVDRVLATMTVDVPAELRELYVQAGPIGLGRLELFTLEELAEMNANRVLASAAPSALFFARDSDGGVLFVDTAGTFGTRGGIAWLDRRIESIVPCATDLATFLDAVARGQRPWLPAAAD